MTAPSSDAIVACIEEQAGGRVTIGGLQPLGGGAMQQHWAVDIVIDGGERAESHACVLRASAPTGVPDSLTRPQEFAVARAAFEAGVTLPEPLWLCSEGEGAYWFARRADGEAAAHRLVRDETLGGPRPALLRRLGEELARIHSVVPPRADLDFLELPELTAAEAAIARLRGHLDAHESPRPVLDWGLRWLELHLPQPGDIVLCHRDFRTGNYLVDADGLTGILDWEFAGWGDPHEDLGWFTARCWRFGQRDRPAGGIGGREDLYAGYEAASGRSVDATAVRWWELLTHVRWAVIAIHQGERHALLGQRSLELALTGRILAELELEVLASVDEWERGAPHD